MAEVDGKNHRYYPGQDCRAAAPAGEDMAWALTVCSAAEKIPVLAAGRCPEPDVAPVAADSIPLEALVARDGFCPEAWFDGKSRPVAVHSGYT